MLVNSEDRTKMREDVSAVIEAFTETAELLRPAVLGAGSFTGYYESAESSLGNVPLEFKQLAPEELKQIGADGVCSLPADSDVQEEDILIYRNVRYKITDVKTENCFGAITHLTVKLERIYTT